MSRSATGRGRRDAGTATAELAMSLPALMLLLVAGMSALSVVRLQLECVADAREVALAQARGEPVPALTGGATVAVSRDGEVVRVVVTRRYDPPGVLPGFDVRGTATAAVEPGE